MSLNSAGLLQWLEGRRSVRRFEDRSLPRELLERILRTACMAPSAHNRQPWRFAVVSMGETRGRLTDCMAAEFRRDLQADGLPEGEVETRIARGVDRLLHAPGAVVLCSTMVEMDQYADPRRDQAERTMALQSASLAGGQLLLAAHAEGLGACWMCGPLFAPQAVRDALDLPADWEPQALIVLGWSAEQPASRARRPFDDTVRWR
jgi:coenzyme F420-0:L-glutamate ligase / coenzyme F420-1:gamma-L-glutamate ligase